MKIYKNIFKFLCIAALSFTACDSDNDIELNEPSHRVIYTSQMDFGNTIEVGNYITFGDVSPGVESRKWTFPENITSVQGAETSDDIVKAYFNKAGVYDVSLNQTFKNDAYVDEVLKGKELDTVIVVTVLEPISISVTANYINPDGTLGAALNMADGAKNVLEASRSIRYTYSVVGAPENTTWNFEEGTPASVENTETVDIKYRKMGVFGFDLVAERGRPFGEAMVAYNDFVEVVPSTDPVGLDAVYNYQDYIALEFSREMDPATLNAADFSVTIDNNGTIINPMIESAMVDAVEGNRILLSLLNETAYNDDTVTVSYTAGSLATLDFVAADSFSDVPLVFVGNNILDNGTYDFGFENSLDTNWKDLGWGAPWNKYSFRVSTAQAYDGTNSGYVEIQPNGGMIMAQVDNDGAFVTFDVEAGKTYELGVWVYVETPPNYAAGAIPPDIRLYWAPATNWGVGPNPEINTNFKFGEWVYSSKIVTFSVSGPTRINLRGDNQSNSEVMKIYLDNLTLIEANLRP
ncbi:hypothetical protein [Pseudotamlana carrageenivorans]|uniref:PKD domain-containing protein n=1 Tax=Pseudotamlana carrageenivorans TaxID=2069432 RepID=A0A2I7SK24_9FLAO|nr:hypothetical protein [Tamlana carrageenivorans]AUS06214.1 hypothetical protein C1A40_12480 [Tamlana carrageenivorans]